MTYNETITNKELLFRAMPLTSLSRKQWESLLSHIKETETQKDSDSTLVEVLNIIIRNQARIEIIADYIDCRYEIINEPLDKEGSELFFL